MMTSVRHHDRAHKISIKPDGNRTITGSVCEPPVTGNSRAGGCALQGVLDGIQNSVSPLQFMHNINTANNILGNRTFLQFVGELQAQRKHMDTHTIAAAGPAAADAPVQMATKSLRALIPKAFMLNRLTPAIDNAGNPFRFKHKDTCALMENYRQGGTPNAGFSRPLTVLNRLAIAHLTGEDLYMLNRAYYRSFWPGLTGSRVQRVSLQHIGQLLNEPSARISGGRFLRYTAADIKGLSQGDTVILPTFNAAELIQPPGMYGLPFDFYTHNTHFGTHADVAVKVMMEIIIPDKHKLALPYGTKIDEQSAYAPHLIHPWVYIVDKVSTVGAGFPDAQLSTQFVDTKHALIKFIKLRALKQTDLHKLLNNTVSVRNLYTGNNISLRDLAGVYGHLFRYRTSEHLPPIDVRT